MSTSSCGVLFLVLALEFCCFCSVSVTDAYSLHLVTFNVNDNKKMPNSKLTSDIAERLLLLNQPDSTMPDIYVVALQENCYRCNSANLKSLAQVFLDQLNKYGNNSYVYVALADTRRSDSCEMLYCLPFASQHGTSVTMVFSRQGLVTAFDGRRRHSCMSPWWSFRNKEKGLVGLKLKMEDGRKLCFVGGHLDSYTMQTRQDCIASFFGSGGDDYKIALDEDLRGHNDSLWHGNCNSIYLAGDFNTRTAEKSGSKSKEGIVATTEDFIKRLALDELSGSSPYTGQSLLTFIQSTTRRHFLEPKRPIFEVPEFVATYSMMKKSKCNHKTPCYNPKRPLSWTDRIVCHNCGRVLSYKPLITMHDLSDHLPVVGVFDSV